MQSIRFHPKAVPTATPNNIIQNIIVQAAIIAAPPTLTIFLKLNSSPKANSKKITPMSFFQNQGGGFAMRMGGNH
jgi:hypothetical protein